MPAVICHIRGIQTNMQEAGKQADMWTGFMIRRREDSYAGRQADRLKG